MRILTSLSFLLLFLSCNVSKHKHISYFDEISLDNPQLNIYTNKESQSKSPVLVFVHGGNWKSGDKKQYGFLGRNFARKGIVTVIPNYTLSPKADYDSMTFEIAQVIQWVKKNISTYGGDSTQIFLTGHSAGGHLIALATLNPKYGIAKGTVAGLILNDAAGLDMETYLKNNPPTEKNDYLTTWTADPKEWKKASPINYLDENSPRMLLYLGTKTYPSITSSNLRFLKELRKYQPDTKRIELDKKHVGMISQFLNRKNERYEEYIDFMKGN